MLQCDGDFKKLNIKLEKEGYGKRNVLEAETDFDTKILCEFWDVEGKGKIKINRTKLLNFLSAKGNFYICSNNNRQSFIQINNFIAEEVQIPYIKQWMKKYTLTLPESFDNGLTPDDISEAIIGSGDTYFSKAVLEFLDIIKLDFLKDTKDTAYFPFRNGIVQVTKDTIELKGYSELNKHVWKEHLIDFYIDPEAAFDLNEVVYYRFINCVFNKDKKRVKFALSIIGYLLHKYKDPARPFAIILAEETEHVSEGGGSGKGIFFEAISMLTKLMPIDGRNLRLDKNFTFQRVTPGTRVIGIHDCNDKTDFEHFYSLITDGLTVEQKHKDEVYMRYDESPKILFSTNYTMACSSVAARRRQMVLEFSSYFNDKHKPEDEFGHILFKDWDCTELNCFYMTLLLSVKLYLKSGLKQINNSENLIRKQVKQKHGEEFLQWWDGYLSNGCSEWQLFSRMYQDFLNVNSLEKKDYSSIKFSKSLKEVAKLYNCKLEDDDKWEHKNNLAYRLIKPIPAQ